jgi:hypothetical protein
MNERKDLGAELLKQNGSPPSAGQAGAAGAAARTMRRERLRMGLWTGATLFLWGLAATACIANMMGFMVFFYPLLTQMVQESTKRPDHGRFVMGVLADYLFYANIIWPLLLTAAAACTVLFILRSRRATLRQIQASLAEISAEVRQLAETRKP